eukprot:436538_1
MSGVGGKRKRNDLFIDDLNQEPSPKKRKIDKVVFIVESHNSNTESINDSHDTLDKKCHIIYETIQDIIFGVNGRILKELDEYLSTISTECLHHISISDEYPSLFCRALYSSILQREAETNESPLATWNVLNRWNLTNITENDLNEIRYVGRDILYCGFLDIEYSYAAMELILDQDHIVPSIQIFDSREVERLMIYRNPKDDDSTIYRSVQMLNQMRLAKQQTMMNRFENDIPFIPRCVGDIIGEFIYAPYLFHFDEADYTRYGWKYIE